MGDSPPVSCVYKQLQNPEISLLFQQKGNASLFTCIHIHMSNYLMEFVLNDVFRNAAVQSSDSL